MDELKETSLAGRTLAHYRIGTAIGAGGMGEVYRATDTKLARDIALKVLPHDMASDPDRLARFQREARAVAALNHPNIVTIYSVEESENVHFITMELIEGKPLDRLISAEGLAADRIIEIAGAIAEALAAAHEKGIVHRDLKPANVMVTNEGRVKVLDFGLAKDVGAQTGGDITLTSPGRTQAGMVMGTPAYMSPEQVSGQPLDHRSDIFSFGVVLHEMVTGRRPFEGRSSAELISSILRDTPPSVTDARPELPSDLARVIRRCLEKDPRYRVQTARDVSNEFRDLTRGASRATPLSTSTPRAVVAADSGAARADEGFWVAVLPFKYSGGSADLAALAEGLTDDIITNMSKFSYLRVIARSSTTRYAQQVVDVRTAAKELGARYVMEGSIRQAGAKVRVAVQLVDANAGASLWAEPYDRSFTAETMLDVLDDIVPRIVATIGDAQGILAHSMTEALRARDPLSLTPYEALLRSFGFHQHVSAEEHWAGLTALENAVKQAPDHADCWAMLSWLYRAEYTHGFHPRPDSMNRSLAAAQRAVNLAPSSQLAHAALACAHFFRGELREFRAAAERALALNRMQGYTTAFLGLQFAYSGDWERGCALCERATQLNPNHPGWYWLPLAINAYRQHDGEQALEYALRVNMPGFWTAQVGLAVVNSQLGRMEQARSALRGLLASRPNFAVTSGADLAIWWPPEIVEQMLGDLRKAGLGVQEAAVAPPSSGAIAAKTASGATRADEGFWVAVLPFKYTGDNRDLKALAEGLSEEVITGLSRFSYLRVIARGSTAKYSSESGDVRAIGKELGARYVMEGSLRQAGSKLRLAAQLVDTVSGAHLWAETYERAFGPESVFEVQDDLVPRIVSTVADQYGILPRSMSETLSSRSEDSLTSHEAVLRAFSYFARLTPEEHATVRRILERVVRQTPEQADCWAMLAMMYIVEYSDSFNVLPNPLERALAAAQRAVDLAPSQALGYYALAWVHFFHKEKASLHAAVERALALNPMDGFVIGMLGLLLHHAGELEQGCHMVEKAMQMNPNYPGLLRFTAFTHAYCQGKYAEALEAAVRINMPGFFYAQAALAAALGQLGRREAAHKAVQNLLALRADFAAVARREYGKWFDPEDIEHFVDGLRKAGLEIPDEGAPTVMPAAGSAVTPGAKAAATSASGATRADEGFWVAVLPFKYTGDNRDLKALAEGLSEEVITGLSRFSYLRVIARGSTAKYSSESGDVRAIGKELGARYVIEGSLRQAGSRLRVAVQLVEAITGSHLWAETYERGFDAEALFELQDDLAPRIVSTVADAYGVLPRTMSQAVRSKSPAKLTPYEALLRSFSYAERVTAQEHAEAKAALEQAVQQAPLSSDCWAMLSILLSDEFIHGFGSAPDPLGRALHAARRAVDAGSSNHKAHQALAWALFFRKEAHASRNAAERTLALNPMDACAIVYMGQTIAFTGDWERGCTLIRRAIDLNPNHPGWYWYAPFLDAYRKNDFRAALTIALKISMPGFPLGQVALAAAYGQLGEAEAGQAAVRELLVLKPDYAAVARAELGKIWSPALVEQLIDGLRKAGLETRP